MSRCGNLRLCGEGFIADRAFRAFGKAGFGTGRSNSRVDNFGMASCINDFLNDKDFVTYGAVFALSKSGFGTSRSNSCVDNLSVACCCFLYVRCVIATATSLISIPTDLGTSGCLRNVIYIIMTECIDYCLSYKDFVTYRAVLTLGKSGLDRKSVV